ncbi:aspartyl protease AED3-like [Zingiber officinale]|uniref:Peptidase A1 domain-containing protein n=1 Tax=Zingiber officinale TaxID=94328 RepID=A0A8J5F4F9_ZINOF|nr:aspartyl protease AED3-like [Zingiber officinale]KAG6480775.1 hypothetical protein ZIOFF_057361 [Zingiber officinale]
MACLLLLLLLSLTHVAMAAAAGAGASRCHIPKDDGSTLHVLHAFGPCSPLGQYASWEDRVEDLMGRDESRLAYLSSLAVAATGSASVPVASGRQFLQIPNYVIRAALGSPAQSLLVALDTSSDAAWVPCIGCVGCTSATPAFDPARSATYLPVRCGSPRCTQVPNPTCPAGAAACSFNLTYGGSSVQAALAQDVLTLASNVVPVYTFGCMQKVTGSSLPPQGLLGLGRGPLSFLSQTRDLYGSTFSYCLPSFKSLNFTGSLKLGTTGQPRVLKTTPLLSNPRRSSLYYVNMTGIMVGRKVLDVPSAALAFDPATGAGTVVDSGTMFTRLVAPAYMVLREEFRRRMRAVGPATSLGGFDTCYSGSAVTPPSVTFMFTGMNVTLPPENVMIHSTAGSTACLAMAAAPDNVNSVLNVFANMQQQNHRVLFDVPNSRIGFAREPCTSA